MLHRAGNSNECYRGSIEKEDPSLETSPERHVGSVKERIKNFTDNHGSTPDVSGVPRNGVLDHHHESESPQWIAAQLAAGSSGIKPSSPAPPSLSKRDNGLQDTKTRQRNTSAPYSHENGSNTSLRGRTAKKPVRPVSQRNDVSERARNPKDRISPLNTDPSDKTESLSLRTPPQLHSVNDTEKLSNETRMTPARTLAPSPGDPSKPSWNPNHLESIQARKGDRNLSQGITPGENSTLSPKRHAEQPSTLTERKPPLPKRTNTSDSKSSPSPVANPSERSTDVRSLSDRPATSRSPSRPGVVSESTLSRVRSQNHSRTSLKPQNTGRTDDLMSDAIAASSIASSRAPSPSRNQPPPPPPKRGTRSRSLLHPHSSRTDDSRTPSPSKGLRETMRAHSKLDDEDDSPKKHSRRRIIKTHPHKHNEGGRKRWRDQISEKERKRYDGVWAANRGLWVSSSGSLTDSAKSRPSSSNKVLNLVVREIWSRSRLSGSVLEQVWDLVDRQGDGMLAREEFAVGMWLIDQRLKGRKLPVKVSMSVWESVRQISGTNVPSLI